MQTLISDRPSVGQFPAQSNRLLPEQGDLADVSPYQVFGLARSEAYSGTLSFTRGTLRKRIHFSQGLPVASASNVVDETLGDILLQRKVIDSEQYEESVRRLRSGQGQQGEILLSLGALDEKVLNQALLYQHRQRTIEVFRWTLGKFSCLQTAHTTEYPICFWDLLRRGILANFGRKVLDESARRHADHVPVLRNHPWARSYARIPEVPDLLRRLAGKATVREFCRDAADGFMDLCILRAWGLIHMKPAERSPTVGARPAMREVPAPAPVQKERAMELGRSYLEQGRYALAAYYFGMVEDAHHCTLAGAYGEWCRFMKEPDTPGATDKLMASLEKGLADWQYESDLWAFRGAVRKILGQSGMAAADLEQALLLDARHPLALREQEALQLRDSNQVPRLDGDAVDWDAPIRLQLWIGPHAVVRNFDQCAVRIGSGTKDDLMYSAASIPGLVAAHCTLTAVGEGISILRHRTDGCVRVNGREVPPGQPLGLTSADRIVLGGNQEHGGLHVRVIDLDVVEQATHVP